MTLIASVSFASKQVFFIHNFGEEEKTAIKIQSDNIF